jgi:hypothetical protein
MGMRQYPDISSDIIAARPDVQIACVLMNQTRTQWPMLRAASSCRRGQGR